MISALAKNNSAMFAGALQQHLRNTPGGRVDARPFTRGSVPMSLTAHGRIEKPAGAWTPEQTVVVLFAPVNRGDFDILCPDNEVQGAPTQSASFGSPVTFPKTARPCHAGTPTMPNP